MARVLQAGAEPSPLLPAPGSLVVLGLEPESPLAEWLPPLGTASGIAARYAPRPGETATGDADLVVSVHPIGDHARRRAFAARPHGASAATLAVAFAPTAALIGPLAIPGRVGCGMCALHRMTAAAGRTDYGEPSTAMSREIAAFVGPELAAELREIASRGPQASRLLDHVMAVDARTGFTTLHRVVPLPHCPVCGGAAALPDEAAPARTLCAHDSPRQLLEGLAGWVDPLTGVIPSLRVEQVDGGSAGLPFVATAAPPHAVQADGSLRRLPLGWGKGLTVSGAILSAVGEAIERYAASLPDPARVRWARPDELDGDLLDPRDCGLYRGDQYARGGFPFVRFEPSVRHPWVLGRWLGSEEPVWVPAVLTFLSLELRPENLICQGTSNGLAASTDPRDAALRATLELVERDALLGAWTGGTAGLRVEVDEALDPALRRVVAGIESMSAAVELYLLPTTACGVTACCLALGDGERWPGVALGLGADLDVHRAVRQAILELGQTGPHLRHLMRSGALAVPGDRRAVREMLDHAAYYFPAERAAAFDRLRAPTATAASIRLEPAAAAATPRSLAACAAALAAANVRVALVDVTSPDVATRGFHVVRAVSPDLQPLSHGYGLDRALVPRLLSPGPAAEPMEIHPVW